MSLGAGQRPVGPRLEHGLQVQRRARRPRPTGRRRTRRAASASARRDRRPRAGRRRTCSSCSCASAGIVERRERQLAERLRRSTLAMCWRWAMNSSSRASWLTAIAACGSLIRQLYPRRVCTLAVKLALPWSRIGPRLVGEVLVVGDDDAALGGRDHLGGVEAERAGDAERAGRSVAQGRAVGVGGIFEQEQPVLVAQRAELVDVGGDEAADVHHDEAGGVGPDRGPHRLDVDGHRRRIAVDEPGSAPRRRPRRRRWRRTCWPGPDTSLPCTPSARKGISMALVPELTAMAWSAP